MNKPASTLSIFWSKPLSQKLLLIRVFLLLCVAAVANYLLPFKIYARFLGEINSESAKNPQGVDWDYVDQIAQSVKNVSLAGPFDFKCLVQATAGKILIARKEIESTLYFGVKRDESQQMKAHAWLRVGSKIVLGGEVADEYNIVSTFC
ncbi:lasso peptide biosynthesis B2 protein [Rhodohalobacter sp. 614A]|uniref:lasso peptide biosynthesis B2 protein n=1 Tax=Rhodohalobacter sp. 614A TaxID=2908649 RepID=UPI001F2DE462|nr:lasso peptide biosynthesis B2 protein [Rhodohalobacter sp. 614A]